MSIARGFLRNFRSIQYKLYLVALLVASSGISLALAKMHARMTHSSNYSFLIFNLSLAWIPFIAAVLAYAAMHKRITFYLVMPVCTAIWLLFFPNAPYLLTDFQHLANSAGSPLLWLDVIILVWFAWTGLLLGIASLWLMQEIVTHSFNHTTGWVFAIGATALSSIGVYLGRFLDWNSWDLLKDPLPIARDMFGIVRHPLSNKYTYVFTILFTLLFLFIYLGLHLFGHVVRERASD